MTLTALPIFVKLAGRPVMLIGTGEAAEAKRRLLERAGAAIVDEDAAASLAIVAADDPEPVVARLRARGVLVNAVDRPDLCDFTLPAIVERDPVLVAVGTGGVSAGLAAALRQKLEAELPADLGDTARALHAARPELRARFPDMADRRRAIAAAAHNGLLMNMFDVVNTARALPVWGSLKRRVSTPERRRCYHDEHTAIVDALRDRDPDGAAYAMRHHLEHVSDNLLGRH